MSPTSTTYDVTTAPIFVSEFGIQDTPVRTHNYPLDCLRKRPFITRLCQIATGGVSAGLAGYSYNGRGPGSVIMTYEDYVSGPELLFLAISGFCLITSLFLLCFPPNRSPNYIYVGLAYNAIVTGALLGATIAYIYRIHDYYIFPEGLGKDKDKYMWRLIAAICGFVNALFHGLACFLFWKH